MGLPEPRSQTHLLLNGKSEASHISPVTMFVVLSPSVTVHKPGTPEQHGEHPEQQLDLHQPVQQRPRSEQRDRPVTLRPAQLHLRRSVPVAGHPVEHRLRRAALL